MSLEIKLAAIVSRVVTLIDVNAEFITSFYVADNVH